MKLLDPDCLYKFTYLMANSADPVQKPTDLDLHCLQRQDISGFSRTRGKTKNIHSITNLGMNFVCMDFIDG